MRMGEAQANAVSQSFLLSRRSLLRVWHARCFYDRCCQFIEFFTLKESVMVTQMVELAAAGWSLMYLILGGGLGGAILIFIIAKMFGK
jgi:hypothetical protein